MFLKTFSLFNLLFFIVISCKEDKVKEIKNENGILTERFQVIISDQQELKHGSYERYDDKGQLAEQSQYNMNKFNGLRKLYNQGILESEETRVNDTYHGPYKEYHPNGLLRMEANYINDVMTGDVKVYYPSGKLKEIVRFADNVENGPFSEYYENGNLKAEGSYKQLDGPVEDGELKLYDTSGHLLRIMNCELGKCVTKWVKDTTTLQ